MVQHKVVSVLFDSMPCFGHVLEPLVGALIEDSLLDVFHGGSAHNRLDGYEAQPANPEPLIVLFCIVVGRLGLDEAEGIPLLHLRQPLVAYFLTKRLESLSRYLDHEVTQAHFLGDHLGIVKQMLRIFANVVIVLNDLGHFDVKMSLLFVLVEAHLLFHRQHFHGQLVYVYLVVDACNFEYFTDGLHTHGNYLCRMVFFSAEDAVLEF